MRRSGGPYNREAHSTVGVDLSGVAKGSLKMETEEEDDPSLLSSCSRREGLDLDVVCREVYFCKFCREFARQPVLNVICGHLFCWSCLYHDVKRKRRQGRRQCCPLCESHLDISPNTSTIIRVCTGPQPGVPAGIPGLLYEGKSTEAKKEFEVKGVPPRPGYGDGSHSSLCKFMNVLFITLLESPMEIEEWCEKLCYEKIDEPESYVDNIREEIPKMIEAVENHIMWLKGEENSGVSRAMLKKKSVVGQNKRISSKKVKLVWRSHMRVRLSSQFFYKQMPRKTKRLKQQLLLHQVDDFAHCLASFSCTVCSKTAYEPVAIKTGHLFCWTCIRGQDNFNCIVCPVTKFSISAVLCSTHATPIYFTCNDHEEEDILLVTNRQTKISTNQNCNIDMAKLPSRPYPTMLAQFLECMIFEIKEEGDVIVNLTSEILPNWKDNWQKVENTCGEIRGRANALFAWLVTAWCAKCNEHESEAKFGMKRLIDSLDKDDYYHKAWERLAREGPLSSSLVPYLGEHHHGRNLED